MNRTKEYKKKYAGALERMFELFKRGIEIEEDLNKKLGLARDELTRISVICRDPDAQKSQAIQEIEGLCVRGLGMTTPPTEEPS